MWLVLAIVLWAMPVGAFETLQEAVDVWAAGTAWECQQDLGNGAKCRDDEKPRKFSAFRVADMQNYCETGIPQTAFAAAEGAAKSWIGQVLGHWRDGFIGQGYVETYLTGTMATEEDLYVCDGSSVWLSCLKGHLIGIAETVGYVSEVEATGMSVLARVSSRVCE